MKIAQLDNPETVQGWVQFLEREGEPFYHGPIAEGGFAQMFG